MGEVASSSQDKVYLTDDETYTLRMLRQSDKRFTVVLEELSLKSHHVC